MKKFKLFMPILMATTLAITGCSYSNNTQQQEPELSKEVSSLGVTIKEFHIEISKQSTLILNLPEGKIISTIKIKVGDTILTQDDVTISDNIISIPASKMISDKVTIISISLTDEPHPEPVIPVNFLDCEWSTIDHWCQELELGHIDESVFCSHFAIDSNSFTSMNDFIGLERTIKINGVDHVIRVIGTNQDTIADEGELKGKKAALTFELKTLLSDSEGNTFKSVLHSSPDNYDYLNIVMRANLCGKGTSTKTWDKTAIEMLEDKDTGCPDLASIIKTTKQVVATATSWTEGIITQTEYCDKVFLPTYYNLTSVESEHCAETNKNTYQFYKNKEAESEEAALAARERTDANGNYYWYWLSSAYANTANGAWAVKTDGKMEVQPNQVAAGVAFAFCI